jgi:hypothetical protein
MDKPISGILQRDALKSASDGFDESGLGTGLGAAQRGFEFAPHFSMGLNSLAQIHVPYATKICNRSQSDTAVGCRICDIELLTSESKSLELPIRFPEHPCPLSP